MFAVLLDDVDQVYTSLEAFAMAVKDGEAVPSNVDPQAELEEAFYEPSAVNGMPFAKHRRIVIVPFGVRAVQRAVWLSMSSTAKRVNPNFFRNVSDHASDAAS